MQLDVSCYARNQRGQAGSSDVGPQKMSTRHDASRIEAQLGHSNPRIRTRALNRLARSSPAERAALQTQAQACEPLLFGTLLELKAGGAPPP